MLLVTLKPSVEQVTSFLPVMSHSTCPAVHTQGVHWAEPVIMLQLCRLPQALGTKRSPTGVQRTTAFALQKVLSATHASSTHSPVAQLYWPGQSVCCKQRVQKPPVLSQSSPSGVHVVSEAHSVRHVWLAHLCPIGQSALLTHSKQRPPAVSHTFPLGQSSELTHGVNGTQALFTQSLLSGQSAFVRQVTQRPLPVSQIVSDVAAPRQSKLFVQLMICRHCRSWQRLPCPQSRSNKH